LDAGQAFSSRQVRQRSFTQNGADGEQWASERQAAHLPLLSHLGVAPEHCPSLVQPALHLKSAGSQMGAAAPQSEFDVHWAHFPTRARQRGAETGQSVLAAHCTHSWVVLLQMVAFAEQSVFDLHPRHWPLGASQIRLSLLHVAAAVPPGVAHDAWHL
jgi:hypothetical protein